MGFAFLGLMLSGSMPALAQDPEPASNSETEAEAENQLENQAQQSVTIEEIVVSAERSFFRLRNQIRIAEVRMYSVYNDFNEVDEFDVDCRKSDWTDSYIQQQICWPAFFEKLVADNAQDYQLGLDILIPIGQLENQFKNKFDELRANITRVAAENPAAREALMEYGKLEEALRVKKEECLKQPAFLFVFRYCR